MKYLFIFLKGTAMGAADVVPGVSGGTIAFITGIYDKLLSSINSVNFDLIKIIKNEGIKAAWNKVNGSFLLALFAGIGLSLFSLSKVFEFLLTEYPIWVWSFFFGLIIASILYIGKQINHWNIKSIIGLIIGTAIVVGISLIPPLGDASSYLYIFICATIAICAMILPGISGSFLLIILGIYKPFLNALSEINIPFLATFGLGAIVGLLSFSRVLKWVLDKHHNTTLSVLTGFLVGSLYKIWPWKHVEEIFVKHLGEPKEEAIAIVEKNVFPSDYDVYTREGAEIINYTSADPQILYAVIFAIIGFAIIFIMEKFAKKN